MTHSMEKVINKIIEIDKKTVRAVQEMDVAFREKFKKVNAEVERMEIDILQNAKEEAKKLRTRELELAKEEAEKIVNSGQEEATALYEKFLQNKDSMISAIFKEII